jgi:hypothetical protein
MPTRNEEILRNREQMNTIDSIKTAFPSFKFNGNEGLGKVLGYNHIKGEA